ncbi:MAG: ankyrin repeat domain-containing protein [Spirochaetaceae bacterium]|nr:ankyrin repeat domain-containing protein [Spirochaetaceae bacterium]
MSRETWRETLCYGTPLRWALMGGHEAAVHRSRGRRQPPPKRDGRTALHCAAATGTAGKLVRMLLDAGADPHALDHAGDRPIDLTRRAKRPTAARLLHEAGAA